MKLCIVHGGQTGVDRGAAFAAADLKLPVAGWMPADMLAEDGPIPAWATRGLKPLKVGGNMQRTVGNVVISNMALCIVEDRQHPYVTPGTALTLQTARSMARPRLAVDASYPLQMIEEWMHRHGGALDVVRLMVAGPRRSKWARSETIAYDIVRGLAERLWSR